LNQRSSHRIPILQNQNQNQDQNQNQRKAIQKRKEKKAQRHKNSMLSETPMKVVNKIVDERVVTNSFNYSCTDFNLQHFL
jgi:hypothetical protein